MPDSPPVSQEIRFGPFALDRANARLTRDGRTVPLTPKSFEVLYFLASRPEKLVSKEQLLAAVWPDAIVGDASVKVCIREIRAALGDEIRAPRYIETVHRKGYRFVGVGAGAEADPPRQDLQKNAADFHDADPCPRAPVVGREPELAALLAAYVQATAGDRRCVFVAGGTGAGKTALMGAFADAVSERPDCVLLQGHCFEQFGVSEPYMPVWEALGRLPRGLDRAVDALLEQHAAVRGDPSPQLSRISEPRVTSERLQRDLLTAIEHLAIRRTVVLVLEDIHWADYSTLDLVTALARRRSPARLLIVATYRREGITEGHPLRTVYRGLAAASLCSEVTVGLLDQAGVEAFLAARFPGQPFPASLARRLHQRTNGHPLFLVHLTNDLISQGMPLVSEEDNPQREAAWLAAIETRVPWTVRAMIEGDFERLPEDRREVLEAAAVAGREFCSAAVAAIVGIDLIQAEEACDDLFRLHRFLEPLGIVEWPDGTVAGGYRFVHEMYHNVVYERISPARKVRMHAAAGLRLEAAWAERAGEEATALAAHFEAGRDWGRAVKYLRRSAAVAAREYAHREALDLLRRASAALEHLPPDEREAHELDVLLALAVNLRITAGCATPEVREVHERAYALCKWLGSLEGTSPGEPAAEVRRMFPVLWGIWVFHKVRSDLGLAETMAGQLLAMARGAGDSGMLLQAHQAVSVTALCLGRLEETVRHMEAAAAIYDRGLHAAHAEQFGQDPLVATQAFGAIALALLGRREEAIAAHVRAVELARQLDQPSSIALATHFGGMLTQLLGDPQGTARWAQETISLSAAEGYSFWLAGSTILAGWARVAVGWSGGAEAEAGIEEIRQGIAAWNATGSRTYLTYYLGLLADAQRRLGRDREAMATLDEALALVEPLGERFFEAALREARHACERPAQPAGARGLSLSR